MKSKILKIKKTRGIIFILKKNTIKDMENFSIIERLEKGNNLLPKNSELSREVFDTKRKALNKWNNI